MRKVIGLLLLLVMVVTLFGLKREMAVYNLEDWLRDENSKMISVRSMLDAAGVPYTVVTDLEDAFDYQYILISSRLISSSFTNSEKSQFDSYVQNGGILIAPRMQDPDLYGLFGISGFDTATNRRGLNWLSDTPGYEMFDDPLEQVISLGSEAVEEVINTTGYTLSTGTAMAIYTDGTIAGVINQTGSGYTYTLGVSFKDVIIRNQLDKDYNANRTYSNGFEPTSDTFFFLMRGIFQEHSPYSVWKYTIPGDYSSAMLVTHDVDSQTAYDLCREFAQMERDHGAYTTYNITTRYFSDYYMGNLWTPENLVELEQISALQHNIGSHSVTHAPDFYSEVTFPVGTAGNDTVSYRPNYNGDYTTGGSVYGELEVSRDLLVQDLGANVLGFRSGHLAFNPAQCNVLDSLGYLFDSSMSANDVLTNFPYYMTYDLSYNSPLSNILEIPMTISDVGWAEETQQEMYSVWVDIAQKNANNYAPTNLLIHPNRVWKLEQEEILIENLGDDIVFMAMEDYGDFWRQRVDLNFHTFLYGDTLLVIIDSDLPDRDDLSFIIEDGQDLEHISLQNSSFETIAYTSEAWQDNDLQIIFNPFSVEPAQPLAAPQNLQLTLHNSDAKLSWSPVTTTIEGEPARADYYLVFYSEYPDDNDLFFYHGYTSATQYNHYGVLRFANSMYYRVVAYRSGSSSWRSEPDLVPGQTTLTEFLSR